MFSVNVSRHWKSGVKDLLCIIHWGLQKVAEIFIFWHVLVSQLTPLSYGLILQQLKNYDFFSCLTKNFKRFFFK